MNKVYLVDDQPIANFITRKLLELEGFSGIIEEFTDPLEALEQIKEDKDSLIFLDLNMPGMNGWEFLDELKSRQVHHNIIVLTSSTSKVDRDKAGEYPCVIKYMVKPMNKKKFAEITGLIKVKVEDNS
ncbi:response regulator [Gramella jeungdoensis]|uniref:Response regulator n=1 Tax=Gramella jeungdoensis TaxID=708091 RepID=A0ABT0YXN9_9FLAO|nr:response regulator [Gramella jeungdoensis]MCM8568234.1 response regulator [Gramella jeungdoensis]